MEPLYGLLDCTKAAHAIRDEYGLDPAVGVAIAKILNQWREKYEAARSMAGQERWEPLADGLYCSEALAIAYNGQDIGIKIDDSYAGDSQDWVNNYEWLSDAHVGNVDGNRELRNIRLCRRVPAGEVSDE